MDEAQYSPPTTSAQTEPLDSVVRLRSAAGPPHHDSHQHMIADQTADLRRVYSENFR
jgi:hypothetical protein